MKKAKRAVCILFSFILLITSGIPVWAQENQNSIRPVRIGFFDSVGYHVLDEDGARSGYGYDFYQMMLRYCNWSYEYLGYEESWSGILKMLDEGKVDVVTLANKTPEREEKYLYSENPVGTTATIMTKNSKNTDIVPGDYETYNGKTIGLVKDSAHNAGFEEYAKNHGFTYQVKYYESATDVLADLREGVNIDMAVTSNMRILHDEVVLDEFNPQPFYAITRKEDADLMEELNQGMSQLNVNSPNWQTELWEKYFGAINEHVISLTPEEREYIQTLKESGQTIKAAMNPELRPYSYFENGEAKGIVPKIFRQIAEKLDIQYEILESKDRWEYKEQLNSGEANIDLTSYLNFGQAQRYHLKETDAYLTSTLAMVSRKDSNLEKDSMTIAVLRDPTEYIAYNESLIFPYHYKEYQSVQECIDAVKNGEVDITYRYVYVAERAVTTDYTNKLQYTVMPNYPFSLAIGVDDEEDHRLLSILNKGVNSISDDYVLGVMLDESSNVDRSETFLSFAYEYPLVLAGIVVLLSGIVILCIFIPMRIRNLKQSAQQERELDRFLGYVCKANEMVMEVNLKLQIAAVYSIGEMGRVETVRIPYERFDIMNHMDEVHPEDVEKVKAVFDENAMKEMLNQEGAEKYIECRRKSDGQDYIWYSYNVQAIPKSKRYPENFILFQKNIDEAKKEEEAHKQALCDALENAKSASEAKGQFLSKMSHEIRTPLNAVIGYMDIAEDSEEQIDKVMHCVHNTKMASKHLLNIINDVLDMSAIESGKMKISHEEFDLREQITNITNIFYNQTKEKGIRFETIIENIEEEQVIGDKLRLNQVFMNLLSNAMKFTSEGGRIQFVVCQKKIDDDKIYMTFQVTDTGIGMSEEYMQRLFQPFEQESAQTAQKYGGSGLGLSITFNLVKMMGGSIEAESKQNVGTTFTVSLHFDRKEQENREKLQDDYSKIRAIIVDNDKGNCEYVKSVLKHYHIKSDIVLDGTSAVRKMKGRMGGDYEYRLCILDMQLENPSVTETAKAIQQECGEAAPLLVGMAYDVAEFKDEISEVGIHQVISKPVFQSSIFDLLVSAFGKYKPENTKKDNLQSMNGLRVLLAEDNPMNMEIAVEILRKAGIVVTPVADGKQAFERFTNAPENSFDAILMDVQMPVMNGYEATGAIRKSGHPQGQTIPIIAMTANAFAEDVNEALASGMNGHIAKPVNYDKLFEALNKFCAK